MEERKKTSSFYDPKTLHRGVKMTGRLAYGQRNDYWLFSEGHWAINLTISRLLFQSEAKIKKEKKSKLSIG